MGNPFAWAALQAVLAALLTAAVRRYALRRSLVDEPGHRRSHIVATPRGGGLAIVVVVLAGCLWQLASAPQERLGLGVFAAGLVLIAAIGWIDDHRSLPALPRLLVQALAAAGLAWWSYAESGVLWHPVLAFCLTMALVNFWNFMDGINGLAVTQALIAAVGLGLIVMAPWQGIAVSLAAACAGFLPFNFPRARIFLGDVGSAPLGFVVSALIVSAMAHRGACWLSLLPVIAFCVDAGFTLLRRMLQREKWWAAHASHAYQRWARSSGHAAVTLTYALFSTIASLVMVLAADGPGTVSTAFFLAVTAVAAVAWLVLVRRYR